MRRLCRLTAVVLALHAAPAGAQGVGFLTEHQRLASYCAGVFEARLREMNEFLRAQCTGSTRRECRETSEALEQAQLRDRRLWDFVTRKILTAPEQGLREKRLAQRTIAKGNDDWLTCQRQEPRKREELLICRETQGCLIDVRFRFLDD